MKKNDIRPEERIAVKIEETNKKKPSGNSQVLYRYSDKELEEFRQLILARLEVAKKEVQYLQGQMQGNDETGADSSEHKFNIEDGSAAMEIEHRGQLAARQIQYINNLEKALIRISNKTYGVCRETGKLIDKARLRAVPHATLSMEAKKKASGN